VVGAAYALVLATVPRRHLCETRPDAGLIVQGDDRTASRILQDRQAQCRFRTVSNDYLVY
jgi:hypothetical protein